MTPKTRGRVIAFIIFIIAMYFAVKYSMLPDTEVDKLRDKIEQKEQVSPAIEQSTLAPTVVAIESTKNIATEPAVIAFQEFVAVLPAVAFIVEIDKYFVPGAETAFRSHLESLGSDPVQVVKSMFDLQDVKYGELKQLSTSQVQFSFTASNVMSRITSSDADDPAQFWQYMIVMEYQHHAWLIKEANYAPPVTTQ